MSKYTKSKKLKPDEKEKGRLALGTEFVKGF
jgi:hypothetical protein